MVDKIPNIRVLIVDDDALFARAIQRNLELLSTPRFECRVVLRHDIVAAAVEDFKPDIVLLDNDFDGDGGGVKVGVNQALPELVGRFRKMTGRVIIVTGKADPFSADDVIAAGAWGIGNFLHKEAVEDTAKLRDVIVAAHERALARETL